MLKDKFSKIDVVSKLAEEDASHVLLDIGSEEGRQSIQIVSKDAFVMYPNYPRLKSALDACCHHFQIERRSLFQGRASGASYVEASREIRRIFLSEITEGMLQGFGETAASANSFEEFSARFVQRAPDASQFVRSLSGTQSFACLFDEVKEGHQKNFARVQAMMENQRLSSAEVLHVGVGTTPSMVIEKLQRLVKSAGMFHEEERAGEIRERFDWRREVGKMQVCGALCERTGEFRSARARRFSLRKHRNSVGESNSNSSGVSSSEGSSSILFIQSPPAALPLLMPSTQPEEIVLQVKEWDPQIYLTLPDSKKPATTVVGPIKTPAAGKKREALFYGRKGALAFLSEFLVPENSTIRCDAVLELRQAIEAGRSYIPVLQLCSQQGAPGAEDAFPVIEEKEEEEARGSDTTLGNSEKRTATFSKAVDSLVDCKARSSCKERGLISFSSTTLPQFFMLEVFFALRHREVLGKTAMSDYEMVLVSPSLK